MPIGTGTPPPTAPPTPTPCQTPPTPTPPTHPPGTLATTTTLRVVPNPAFEGLPIILLVQVSPFGASGTIQLTDGPSALGTPVSVFAGFALTITTLPKGVHMLSATFTPMNPAVFASSISTPVSLTVQSLFSGFNLGPTTQYGSR